VNWVRGKPDRAVALFDLLETPFAVESLRSEREQARVDLALQMNDKPRCVAALAPFEAAPTWDEQFLRNRLDCYQHTSNPLQTRAREDLLAYLTSAGAKLSTDLLPDGPPPAAADSDDGE
jgi:hypothetical protein